MDKNYFLENLYDYSPAVLNSQPTSLARQKYQNRDIDGMILLLSLVRDPSSVKNLIVGKGYYEIFFAVSFDMLRDDITDQDIGDLFFFGFGYDTYKDCFSRFV